MNMDTGRILMIDDNMTDAEALAKRLVPINANEMTPKQRDEMRVSLADHTSTLGRQLTAARSKYQPHMGAKQAAKLAARAASGENAQADPRQSGPAPGSAQTK